MALINFNILLDAHDGNEFCMRSSDTLWNMQISCSWSLASLLPLETCEKLKLRCLNPISLQENDTCGCRVDLLVAKLLFLNRENRQNSHACTLLGNIGLYWLPPVSQIHNLCINPDGDFAPNNNKKALTSDIHLGAL